MMICNWGLRYVILFLEPLHFSASFRSKCSAGTLFPSPWIAYSFRDPSPRSIWQLPLLRLWNFVMPFPLPSVQMSHNYTRESFVFPEVEVENCAKCMVLNAIVCKAVVHIEVETFFEFLISSIDTHSMWRWLGGGLWGCSGHCVCVWIGVYWSSKSNT